MDIVRNHSSIFQALFALLSGTVLGIIGLLTGAILTIVVILITMSIGLNMTPAVLIVVGLIFTQGVGCIGITVLYLKYRSNFSNYLSKNYSLFDNTIGFTIPYSNPSKKDIVVIISGYLLALFGAIVGGAIGERIVRWLGEEMGQNAAAGLGLEQPSVLLLLIPASILIIGPGEELLFRGVVQGRFREVFSPATAVIIASALFSGVHWFALSGGSPIGNLIILLFLMIPALVFGISYEYTDNIVVPALIHGLYNATLFTGLYLAIRFGSGV